jgi:hypothetical protein
MVPENTVLHLRFGLRSLLVAVASCAGAFAVIAQRDPDFLVALAACVPAFWLGASLLVFGDALTMRNSALLDTIGEVCMSIGLAFVMGSIAFASVCAFAALAFGAFDAITLFRR